MNAGAYGTEVKDLLESAAVVERNGQRRRLGVSDLKAGYRRTVLQETGTIVMAATFRLVPGDPGEAMRRIEELNRRRWESLPSGRPNAGSIFRNPPGEPAGRLIDLCELKGASCGQASISEKHANVIINHGQARASDVLELMTRAYRAVWERFGIRLVPEIVLAGPLRQRWEEAVAGACDVPRL
jgi:UDP-N-acetylmuramate dehydrogenase